MNTPTIAAAREPGAGRRAALAILVGGLVAGTIDIGAAALISIKDPLFIMRVIAGGVQGPAALQGGAASAWLGLFLQWGMSILIAAIFVIAARRLRWMTARWIVAGLAYGVVIFLVMNYVVLALSAWGHVVHFKTFLSFFLNLLAMLLFGLIVSFAARHFLRKT